MSKLGYPLTFHPSQQQQHSQPSPLPITSSSPTTHDEGDDQVSVSSEPPPVDTGLIQCICESTEDDGFTIQCDRCLTWQHAYCMNITQNSIPDRYICDDCTQRLAIHDGAGESHQRTSSKQNNTIKGESTKALLATGTTSPVSTPSTTKRKEDKSSKSSPNGTHNGNHHRSLSNKTLYSNNTSNNKRPRFHLDDQSTFTSETIDVINKSTPKKPKLSKRISVSKRSLQRNLMEPLQDSRTKPTTSVTKRPTSKKKEVKYQPTTTNTVKSKFVHEVIKETSQRWKDSPKWKSQPWRPQQPHQGPFIVMDQFALDQSSATHITIRSLTKQQTYHRHHPCKLRKGVFANTQLYANTFLLEAHGEMLLKSEYKFDAANDYAILGTPRSHVLFYPTLDLCIDGRRLGNDSRYFRRSCHPNAELRTMVFPTLDEIRLGLFTRKPIEPGEEITLGWNWQKGHVSWRKNVEWYRQEQNRTVAHTTEQQQEEQAGREAIEAMLDRFKDEFGDCACSEHDVCLIERLGQDAVEVESTTHSRQIIVAPNHSPPPTEENGDIDVISMSPSSFQQGHKKESDDDDDDDELDIDGDIDIGDELPPVKPSSLSSMSSLSEDDDDLSSKKKRGPLDRKLPCKKAWMRHYLQHTVKNETDSSDEKPLDNQVKKEEEDNKTLDEKSVPMDDQAVDIDDGELSDASSASTIPLDEDDRDWNLRVGPLRSNYSPQHSGPSDDSIQPTAALTEQTQMAPIPAPSTEMIQVTPQSTTIDQPIVPANTTPPPPPHPETLENFRNEGPSNEEPPPQDSADKEDPKPTKVKVSLQEYLQSRRAAHQETPELTQSIP